MIKLIVACGNFATAPDKEKVCCVEWRKNEESGGWRKLINEELLMRPFNKHNVNSEFYGDRNDVGRSTEVIYQKGFQNFG